MLAQCYVPVALFRGLFFYRGEKTPYSHAFIDGFLKLLFAARVIYVDPIMREKVRQLDRCVLLYNHRSVADFTACMYTTAPDRVSYIGRLTAFIVFPVAFCFFYLVENNFVLFNRGAKDRKKLKKRLFSGMLELVQRGLFVVVFPEGHRNTEKTTLPLKRGAINWAYEQGLPCAIVLHDGNEDMINEKALTFHRGVQIRCLHKGIYLPKDYSNRRAFFDTIASDFAQGYQDLIATK